MKSFLFFLLCLTGLTSFGQTDKQKLEQELFDLPNISFKDVSKPGDPFLTYDLFVRQPIDHQHPENGYFYQYVQLRHRGFDRPTVIETHGYQLYPSQNEVEQILDANDLGVEYRFFGKSVPDSVPWKQLSLEQETADLHAINQLFRQIYKGKWISTGISKGGQTTLFYKYFYPEDVDVSIPYVAPIDNALEDTRIYTFLDTIGTPECRQKILNFQKFLLQHEDQAVEKLKWYAKGAGLKYSYTGSIGKSFEYAVMEYSFSFWQWGRSCDSIPTNQSLDAYLSELLKTSNIAFFADDDMKIYAPHYFQSATETGYYSYNIEPFRKYLQHFNSNPSAIFPPKGVKYTPANGELNEKLQEWLKANGNNILYIYGGQDTWSAARVLVSNQVNSESFLIPGANHGTARIKNLTDSMKKDFVAKIKAWTGLDCNLDALNKK